MKFLKILFSFILIAVVIVGSILFVMGYFKPPKAGIAIITDPSAVVFINGNQVGKSTYEGNFDSGEAVIRLVPESFNTSLESYETKVNLISGVKTIIQHSFAPLPELASGVVVSFEKITSSQSEIALVSNPDTCKVIIDGQVRGFTPYKSTNIKEGEHELIINCPKYQEKSIKVKTNKGYKLVGVFNLGKDKDFLVTTSTAPSPTPVSDEKYYMVVIKETPTGYLRVRESYSALSKEVGQVSVGSRHLMLEEDATSGWFKIELSEDKSGWVTAEYAYKEDYIPTPAPSPTLSASASASPSVE